MEPVSATLGLAGVLAQCLAVSAGIGLICQGLFDTRWFNRWIGDGVDGRPSRFLPNWNPKAAIAIGMGIYLNKALLTVMFFSTVAGKVIPNPIPSELVPGLEADVIATGILFGLGPKIWLRLSRDIFGGQRRILDAAQTAKG